jgi:hypothetical protein
MQDYDEYCDNEGQNNEYQAEELNDTDYEVESNDHEQLPVFLGRPSSPMKTHMVINANKIYDEAGDYSGMIAARFDIYMNCHTNTNPKYNF